MITAHNIGYMGQLGNQLFQYATLIGVSEKTGFEMVLPADNTQKRPVEVNADGKRIEYGLSITDCFDIPDKMTPNQQIFQSIRNTYKETCHNFNSSIFGVSDFTSILGFFETEKYFEHAKNRVLNSLKFKKEIYDIADKKFKSIIRPDKQNVCLHIRHHTQYSKTVVHHPIMDVDYYRAAMQFFPEDRYNFIAFSDRMEIEEQLRFPNLIQASWATEYKRPDLVDLCMISMCDHHIIANSSFSWWGAWLANKKDQIVVAPKLWFGPGLSGKNTDDVIPSRWIKI